jgi:hypothetical protein
MGKGLAEGEKQGWWFSRQICKTDLRAQGDKARKGLDYCKCYESLVTCSCLVRFLSCNLLTLTKTQLRISSISLALDRKKKTKKQSQLT